MEHGILKYAIFSKRLLGIPLIHYTRTGFSIKKATELWKCKFGFWLNQKWAQNPHLLYIKSFIVPFFIEPTVIHVLLYALLLLLLKNNNVLCDHTYVCILYALFEDYYLSWINVVLTNCVQFIWIYFNKHWCSSRKLF